MNKSYTYKGESIIECERVKGEHPGNWIVPARHRPTGLPYSDELCPHFHTLQDARDYINRHRMACPAYLAHVAQREAERRT